ncbi:MAG: porin family protein [Colwellia sp.]
MKKVVLSVLLMSSVLPAMAESNFSAELLLGKADQELSVGSYSISGDSTSVGIRGIYSLNENFSVEGTYQSYGETDETYIDSYEDTINDKLSTSALSLGIKGIIPLNNGVSLNARAGISFWDAELKETDSYYPGVIFVGDDNGNDFYYGIGGQYDINPQMFIGVEYTMTKMAISTEGVSADLDVKNISLSLGYKF